MGANHAEDRLCPHGPADEASAYARMAGAEVDAHSNRKLLLVHRCPWQLPSSGFSVLLVVAHGLVRRAHKGQLLLLCALCEGPSMALWSCQTGYPLVLQAPGRGWRGSERRGPERGSGSDV